MAFAKGVSQGPMVISKAAPAHAIGGPLTKGTRITFKPDATIFKSTTKFDLEKVLCCAQ